MNEVIFKIGVALDHPDVPEHLVEHPSRAAGDPFTAQFLNHIPGRLTEEAHHYLPIGERGVVVRDFPQSIGCFRHLLPFRLGEGVLTESRDILLGGDDVDVQKNRSALSA